MEAISTPLERRAQGKFSMSGNRRGGGTPLKDVFALERWLSVTPVPLR